MKVSEKQLLMLVDILKDSLKIPNIFGGYDVQTRHQLVNDLMNQQSNDLKEVDSIDHKREKAKREVRKVLKQVLNG